MRGLIALLPFIISCQTIGKGDTYYLIDVSHCEVQVCEIELKKNSKLKIRFRSSNGR
jgi:hypothetical protein